MRRSASTMAGMLVLLFGHLAEAQWVEIDKLTAADAAMGDGFGSAVSIDGDIAVVGAPNNDDSSLNSGSAYVFDTRTGQQLHKLTAEDPGESDWFGSDVSISGETAIIGAFGDNHAGFGSGSAYLFDVTTGQQLHKLTAEDAANLDSFGWRVSISGGFAIVGAPGHDGGAGSFSGAAYLFDVGTGRQLHMLTADDGGIDDMFGTGVAIDGEIAIVGAPNDDNAGGTNSGSVYLFDAVTGQQLEKLTASDAAEFGFFGTSVAIEGGIAIVGAPGYPGLTPASAYLFDIGMGQQLHKLTAESGRVAISDGVAVVGAYGDDDADVDSGAVYVFDVATGQQLDKLTASDAAAGDALGYSVATGGGLVLAGAPVDGEGEGSVYLFAANSCPADISGDGAVDVTDLVFMILAWGQAGGEADLNEDGTVDVLDLIELIVSWGACA